MAELRALAIFVKVAERRSFVRAAVDLGITQSGVSNAVKRLEEQTGTRLLACTTRRVTLTEDGVAFFKRCRQGLAEIEEAELVLKEARLKPSGNLRVDMSVAFGRLKMVPLLSAFQDEYPDIRLSLTFTDRYADLFEEGVDVAVRLGVLRGFEPHRAPLNRCAIQARRHPRLFRQTWPAQIAGRPGQVQLPGLHLARYPIDEGLAFRCR